MEPMVAFSSVLVVYYAYLALVDAFRDVQRDRSAAAVETAVRQTRPAGPGEAVPFPGLEKLSRTLACRSRKLNQVSVVRAAAWRQAAL
jgi:hypothetical protein